MTIENRGTATVMASGVANTVLATGGCNFTDTGVDNSCQTTDMAITVTDIACRGPAGTAFCKGMAVLLL